MADFWVSAYKKTEEGALKLYDELKEKYPNRPWEVWEIQEDKYGNRFVLICRERFRGRSPKLTFKKRIR